MEARSEARFDSRERDGPKRCFQGESSSHRYGPCVDPKLRIVTRLPLDELWTDEGPLEASRGAALDAAQVVEYLREGADGVVANIGEPLRWLRGAELYDWWKREAKPRLLDPEAPWSLDELPDERGWLATAWTLADSTPALVFEQHH